MYLMVFNNNCCLLSGLYRYVVMVHLYALHPRRHDNLNMASTSHTSYADAGEITSTNVHITPPPPFSPSGPDMPLKALLAADVDAP
jgi:hypothetical protein